MHEVTLHSPRTLQELATSGVPEELSGRDGRNRAKDVCPQITAQTDLDAIGVWLNEFPQGGSTRRSYLKEVQRFYAWVLAYARKPMSSLTREDLSAYQAFMRKPPSEWCAPRSTRKESGHWQPFEGPLSPSSQAHAVTVLNALFTYLVGVNYLAGNPLAAVRGKRRGIPKPGKLPKFIPLHTFERLLEALQSECERLNGLGQEHVELERMLMVVRVLANTGLRREELANALLGDLYPERDIISGADFWFLTVTGKGDKIEPVAVNPAALAAIRRYLRVAGVDPDKADPLTPLVLKLRVHGIAAGLAKPTTDQTIYNIVRKALSIGADILLGDHPDEARILRSATPHWFRHTFTTIMSQLGTPLPLIQHQLRHESIATTAIYTHSEKHELYRAVAKLTL